MGFGDLKSRAGQQALNQYLADKSYIEGFLASQADNVIFEALGSAPPTDLFHALRFFKHINSFNENDRKAFPGLQVIYIYQKNILCFYFKFNHKKAQEKT
jgi:elongation factor 1-beta